MRSQWHYWNWSFEEFQVGTCLHQLSFGVAGVALMTGLALVVRLGAVSRPWRHGTLRGRRGTWRHRHSICMAGVALGDIDVSFAWHIHAASESISLKYDFVTHTTWSRTTFHTYLSRMQLYHTHSFVRHNSFAHTAFTHTHNFVTHNFVTHTRTHTIFHTHTHLSHMQLLSLSLTPIFVTHNCVTHTFFHTQLCHKQLCHTQLFHTQLWHTILHTQLWHTHTTFHTQCFTHTQLCHTQLFSYNF